MHAEKHVDNRARAWPSPSVAWTSSWCACPSTSRFLHERRRPGDGRRQGNRKQGQPAAAGGRGGGRVHADRRLTSGRITKRARRTQISFSPIASKREPRGSALARAVRGPAAQDAQAVRDGHDHGGHVLHRRLGAPRQVHHQGAAHDARHLAPYTGRNHTTKGAP